MDKSYIDMVAAVLVAAWTCHGSIEPPHALQLDPGWEVSVAASGLLEPHALAVHPRTGELYVTEPAAGRVSVLRGGALVPVVTNGFTVVDDLPDWAVDVDRPRAAWLAPHFTRLRGLAVDEQGAIFVVEETRTGGRLLKFPADTGGTYRQAEVIPIPWTSGPYAWESVGVAPEGRIFVSGTSVEDSESFLGGAVMGRDTDGEWWLIDQGPMASFTATALSQQGDVLVVGDAGTGSVTWWDTRHRNEIDTIAPRLGPVVSVSVLPDGSMLAAIGPEHDEAGAPTAGQVARVDPSSRHVATLATGFSGISAVAVDPRTGTAYVADQKAGTIYTVSSRAPLQANEKLLQRVTTMAAASHGFAPTKWPPFLSKIFSSAGIDPSLAADLQTVADDSSSYGEGEEATSAAPGPMFLTPADVGNRMPMVAGKIRFDAEPTPEDPDPLQEMNFLQFYPRQVAMSGKSSTPSLALFAAKRVSGKVEKASPALAPGLKPDLGAVEGDSEGDLKVPLTLCSAVRRGDTVTLTLCFLGLRGADYYLTLNFGKVMEGSLVTSKRGGGKMRSQRAHFVETDAEGNEVMNLVLTGFLPRAREIEGWYRVGKHNRWSMATPERDIWLSRWTRKNMPSLADRMLSDQKEQRKTARREGTWVPDLGTSAAGAAPRPSATPALATTRPAGSTSTNAPMGRVVDAWNKAEF